MNENKKFCGDCKTAKTPLWRTGPAGPRTLCNACGIRYRKRKVGDEGQRKSTQPNRETSSSSSSSSLIPNDRGSRINSNANLRESLKLRLMYLETEMMFHTAKSPAKKQRSSNSNSGRRKLGEVGAAAVLLMSLSCGSVS